MSEFAESIRGLSPKRLAIIASDLERELRDLKAQKSAPIAIIGVGCRFPGSDSAEAYWRLLQDQVDAVSEIPADRWDVERYYDPDPEAPGKMYTRYGGFIGDIDNFDYEFFGISRREALRMDPQQRLLLEVAWNTLEHAGCPPSSLAHSQTGVFVGLSTNDYLQMGCRRSGLDEIDAWFGTGTAASIAAGRLSYVLGLHGPNVCVDTACSSSLVAVHLACQSLRQGECSQALVGGVNLVLTPESTIYFCKVRALAADGRCKSFDAAADGYGRGEGCGFALLKPLSKAIEDGDRVLAVIRGTAINHDGRTSGLTVPNRASQESLLELALANAGVQPADVGYVEAHGTGTRLGDPIELQAMGSVYGRGRSPSDPLLVGSVKTNVGHLEAAAGIAGLIKVALSLEHGVIPAQLHFNNPNPHIPWEQLPLRVVSEASDWETAGSRHLAGLSSFGFSGTNAHVILEEAPPKPSDETSTSQRPLHVLCLSAKTDESLTELAEATASRLEAEPTSLADACYTANAGRSHFRHRLAVTAKSVDDAVSELRSAARTRDFSEVDPEEPPRIAFLFSGQGSQYSGMGRFLFETQPLFRKTLQTCEEILADDLEQPLLTVMFDASSGRLLDQSRYTQPALFALEYALATLWKSWGIEPAVVMGHSVGEYTAAAVAGAFSLEDGLKLIAQRALLMETCPGQGGMLAVFSDGQTIAPMLSRYHGELSLAALNGPQNTVVSGESSLLASFGQDLHAEGIRSQPLQVSHAFHSVLMEPAAAAFREVAEKVQHQPRRVGLISNITGQLASGDEVATADYWCRHILRPVQFAAGMETLDSRGYNVLVEIGPQATLLGMGRRSVPDRGQLWLPSLRKDRDWEQMLETCRAIYLAGAEVDWRGFDRPDRRSLVSLPSYPFRGLSCKREWTDSAKSTAPNVASSDSNIEPAKEPLYFGEWVALSGSTAATRRKPGRWVVFADRDTEGATIARELAAAGEESWLVERGSEWQETSERILCVNPRDPADWQRVAETLMDDGDGRLGIVYCWSLDDAPVETTLKEQQLMEMQVDDCENVATLVQSLASRRRTQPTRLWLITREAQRVLPSDHVRGFARSSVWGLGRTIAIEHPDLQCTLIDIDELGNDESRDSLIAHLRAGDREGQWALRQGKRFGLRLLEAPADEDAPRALDFGRVLITGGLGGLGLLTARWLVEQGATQLTLLGRSEPSTEASAAVEAMRERGATIEVVRADVSREDQMAPLIRELIERDPPLKGIVHAAGVLDDAPLAQLNRSSLQKVLQPKVSGAWLLHRLTANVDLDLFVCYSSAVALTGSMGQANYSAANSFLDALTQRRRALGLPGLSLNWGPWAGAGMAARLDASQRRRWRTMGVDELDPELAFHAFSLALQRDWAQLCVLPVDWSRFLRAYPPGYVPALLDELVASDRASGETSDEWQTLVSRVRRAPRKQAEELVARFVEEVAALVLGLDPSTRLERERGFFELGMDSLMSVEFRNRLQGIIGNTHFLPMTIVLDRPNVNSLVEYFCDELLVLESDADREPKSVTRRTNEPIAVIGLGCRLPGGIGNPDDFWNVLKNGVDTIQEVPSDRWDVDAYFDPDVEAVGRMNTRFGGWLTDVDRFDAQFFGISPREAESLDPQQRILLEVTWEALENANIVPAELKNTPTGVFVGISGNDYIATLRELGSSVLDPYFATGNSLSVAAGRISHVLGLQGPCLAIDTACSSSLVAIHLAVESLRSGDSKVAIAGGVNLILRPDSTISLSKAQMMAADGRCKTFDAAADGYVRSEGCGVIILKRLSEALADGDEIAAVIRGSAVNHDGRCSGLTVPNGVSQRKLLRHAMEDAGVTAEEISYLEAHGTGTPLGDPIELQAIGEAIGTGHSQDAPVLVGSVKTNVGHTESAAGATGVIKTVLALKNAQIPPHLHFQKPNPYVEWDQLPVSIPTKLTAWSANAHPRRAGVSAFGFSGTNAHVILEEAPPTKPAEPSTMTRPRHLLSLSAKTPSGLDELSQRVAVELETRPGLRFEDYCHTAGVGRTHFPHRVAVTAASAEEAARALRDLDKEREHSSLFSGLAETGPPRVAFLFGGLGTESHLMGRHLYRDQPLFRRAMDQCEEILRPLSPGPLFEELYRDDSSTPLHETPFGHPALFAVQYSLAELWRQWGITPAVVLGHSLGELVAATVAGACTLETGITVSARLASRLQGSPSLGAMLAIFARRSELSPVLEPHAGRVHVAVVNHEENTVVSGRLEDIEDLVAELESRGWRYQRMRTTQPFHSPLMRSLADEIRAATNDVEMGRPRLRMVSSFLGTEIDGDELRDPDHWVKLLSEPFHYPDAVGALDRIGVDGCLEVGPTSSTLSLTKPLLSGQERFWLPSLRSSQDDWTVLLSSLARLYVLGADVDFRGFDAGYTRAASAFPRYPFAKQRFWVPESKRSRTVAPSAAPEDTHARAYGSVLRSPSLSDTVYEQRIASDGPSLLEDHRIYSMVVVPGAWHLAVALSALSENAPGAICLESITFPAPTILAEGESRTVQLILSPENHPRQFKVLSTDTEADSSWTLHAEGSIGEASSETSSAADLESIRERLDQHLPESRAFYQQMSLFGIELGPSFQWLGEIWRTSGEALSRLVWPEQPPDSPDYALAPGLIDCCFQLVAATLSSARLEQDAYIPIGVQRLEVHRQPEGVLWLHARLQSEPDDEQHAFFADVSLFDDAGAAVASMRGVRLQRAPRETLQRLSQKRFSDWLYRLEWREESLPSPEQPQPAGSWILVGESNETAVATSRLLGESGGQGVVSAESPEAVQRAFDSGTSRPRGIVLFAGCSNETTDAEAVLSEQRSVCESVLEWNRWLSLQPDPPSLWLVTSGAQQVSSQPLAHPPRLATLWGLGRVMALEHPNLSCVRIDLDPNAIPLENARMLSADLAQRGREDQIAYRNEQRWVPRLARELAINQPGGGDGQEQSYRLVKSPQGVLADLALQPTSRRQPGPTEIEIEVQATGLNFRDVLNALNLYPGDAGPLGLECAGTVVARGSDATDFEVGQRVMAVAAGCFSSTVIVEAHLASPLPDQVSYHEGAAIPIAYLTAEMTLRGLVNLTADDTVLIHAAAGGVGMAAVAIAQRVGATIIGTAGSDNKRELLASLGVHHVFDSRSLSFADDVRRVTEGRGANVVLNSLAGEFIPTSFSVTADNGRFVEIGKRDIWDEARAREVRSDVSYHVFALDDLVLRDSVQVGQVLRELAGQFQRSELRLPQTTEFPMDQAADAFRFMAQAKHVGKIVIVPPVGEDEPETKTIRSDATYLITGGLGGLGWRLCHWLVARGAKHIVLLSRRAPSSEYRAEIERLSTLGVEVATRQGDVSIRAELAEVIREIESGMPPLKGVFHLSGVLNDGLLAKQTWDEFAPPLAPKLVGGYFLHELTAELELDHFVLFSSIASVLGSPGQGSYAAGNAFLDALAEFRVSRGLPALSINWGPLSEAGMAARSDAHVHRQWELFGLSDIAPDDAFLVMESLLTRRTAQVAVVPIDWTKFAKRFPMGTAPPMLESLTAAATRSNEPSQEWLQLVEALEAAPPGERVDMLVTHIQSEVKRILGLDGASPLSRLTPLTDLGFDSLMAVELANRLSANAGISLPMTLLFDYPNIESISHFLLSDVLKLGEPPQDVEQPAPSSASDTTDDLIESLEGMTDAEVDRFYEERFGEGS